MTQEKDFQSDSITAEEYSIHTLILNAKLDEETRAAVEDVIDMMLEEEGLGFVGDNSSFTLAKDGSVATCSIEIALFDKHTKALSRLLAYLKDNLIIPKGSKITHHYPATNSEKSTEIGETEGLEIALNAVDLPQEVYRSSDIDKVCEALEKAMNGKGYYYGFHNGEHYTSLYFYGDSYEAMKAAIQPLVAKTPLCEKCIINRIA
ncbi:hypothetical protein [Porphyromonas sp.]|uniref:hypothetical protein n=1 Tax=Porphyromonas sp. TaxID=1924944 RepID=UPI0026DBB9B6|nr:hypothetical protein [Porphyromonas sp.]MDO4771846.1 hypothetical protein [Porphyromonas sp.]